MYEVVYSKQAQRTLLKLPKPIAGRLRDKISIIAQDPHEKHQNVTKLRDRSGFRLRLGNWRVIYEIEDDELRIIVIKIAPRGSVYR